MEQYFHVELNHPNVNRKFITELFQRKFPAIKSLHYNDQGHCSIYTIEKPEWLEEICESFGITGIITETAEERASRIEQEENIENDES